MLLYNKIVLLGSAKTGQHTLLKAEEVYPELTLVKDAPSMDLNEKMVSREA